MDKQLKNLFPAALRKGAIEIFGDQSMQPVLLGLLSATTNSEHPLPDSCSSKTLHPNEIDILSGYRFPKRRSEYLTGRICAKMAIQKFITLTKTHPRPLILPEIEITNTATRRPIVRIHGANTDVPKLDISIAHSGDFGVALASGSRCGIDLQRHEETLLRVKDKYCSEREHRLLETFLTDNDMITRLNILWAAKEAAKKALSYWQMPGFLDLELQELKRFTNCITLSLRIPHAKSNQMPKEATVAAGMFGDYALAICLINEVHKDAGTT